jgi:F-type H+-transporting ATPase subunit 8
VKVNIRINIINKLFFFTRKLLYLLFYLLNMPQLIPFYFLNQFSFAVLALFLLVALLSFYFLPVLQLAQVTRVYITKLSNK